MKKAAVIYESKYGSTKKYAEWIAQSLACDLFEKKNMRKEQLKKYDIIIYGGGLYAGGVSGIDLIAKSFANIRDKEIIVFTCGLADPNDSENTDRIRAGLHRVLGDEAFKKIEIFHLRGGIDYSKLGIVHKSMMAMLHKMTLKKGSDSLRNEDREMLDTYGKAVDFTDINTIEPLVSYVKRLEI